MKAVSSFFSSYTFVTKYLFAFAPLETVFSYLFSFIRGVLPYLNAFLLGKLVTIIVASVNSGETPDIWGVLILYAIVGSAPALLGNFQAYVNKYRLSKMQVGMEIEMAQNREKIDIATYEDPKFQDLVQRAFRNRANPVFQLSNSQLDVLRTSTSLIVGTILAAHFNILVYIVVILSAVPSFVLDIRFGGFSWSIWAKDSPEQRRLADLRRHINSRFSLIETKLLQSGGKIIHWMKEILENFAKKQLSLEKSKLLQFSFADTLSFLGGTLGVYLIIEGVLSGAYEIGGFVYMMSTLSNLRGSISEFLSTISSQYENHLMVQDMIVVFNTKPHIIEAIDPKIINLKTAPEITFEKVSFKYQNSKEYTLKDLSFTFTAGDNIGLVGNNGAGKTTLIKLLCRIYEPTKGRILINGVDLRVISTKEWWSYLAVMFQDYSTYDFKVKEAIAIGRPDKSPNMPKVIEAAHTSQAHEFVEGWKHKYNEQLGVEFGGKEPSKGQRQKLSIAKTLYRDGYVMILDEPTASVDAESEAKIFDSIENIPKDRTAVLISHDFSTISECDKIFVLDEGKMIEQGTHEELMSQNGMYANLYNLQADRFKN